MNGQGDTYCAAEGCCRRTSAFGIGLSGRMALGEHPALSNCCPSTLPAVQRCRKRGSNAGRSFSVHCRSGKHAGGKAGKAAAAAQAAAVAGLSPVPPKLGPPPAPSTPVVTPDDFQANTGSQPFAPLPRRTTGSAVLCTWLKTLTSCQPGSSAAQAPPGQLISINVLRPSAPHDVFRCGETAGGVASTHQQAWRPVADAASNPPDGCPRACRCIGCTKAECQGPAGCASSDLAWRREPDGYLKQILTARVYKIAVETPLQPAPILSKQLGNSILLKREDLQVGA